MTGNVDEHSALTPRALNSRAAAGAKEDYSHFAPGSIQIASASEVRRELYTASRTCFADVLRTPPGEAIRCRGLSR